MSIGCNLYSPFTGLHWSFSLVAAYFGQLILLCRLWSYLRMRNLFWCSLWSDQVSDLIHRLSYILTYIIFHLYIYISHIIYKYIILLCAINGSYLGFVRTSLILLDCLELVGDGWSLFDRLGSFFVVSDRKGAWWLNVWILSPISGG